MIGGDACDGENRVKWSVKGRARSFEQELMG
jgi:hypothetical protein